MFNTIPGATTGNDTLIGSATLANYADGDLGNDSIVGGDLDDSLRGGGGNDTLIGGVGNDTLDGGSGNDSMVGGLGDDFYIVSTPGFDLVFDTGGYDTVLVAYDTTGTSFSMNSGGWENIEEAILVSGVNLVNLTGNTLNNVLRGDARNNSLDGGSGNDTLYGGAGNDTYTSAEAQDVIVETNSDGSDSGGIDWVLSRQNYTLGANIENLVFTNNEVIGVGNTLSNVIIGQSFSNSLSGLEGNDTLDGGQGDDTLNGGSGIDSLFGSNGNDLYIVDDAADIVDERVTFGTSGNDTVRASLDWTLGNNLEVLDLSFGTATRGQGNSLSNRIIGNAGDNVLLGSASGDGTDLGDTLDGGAGADTMVGGAGNDYYVVDNARDIVDETIIGSGGTDTVFALIDYTLSLGVEALDLSGGSAIAGTGNAVGNTINGNAADNVLTGAEGNDTLIGGAGNDTLDGGSGNDSLVGGTGNDLYLVDSVNDVILESSAITTESDTVRSSVDWILGNNLEVLDLSYGGAISGYGNALNNLIIGNNGNNTLGGGQGNDTLIGGEGADTLYGGQNNDFYYVDNLGDLTIEQDTNPGFSGIDTVVSTVNWLLGDNIENLILQGTATVGVGNSLNNRLSGTGTESYSLDGAAGEDLLFGGSGNDVLVGGLGNDYLSGGAGNDLYYVDSVNDYVYENDGFGIPFQGDDTIISSVDFYLSAGVETLILTGTAISGTGNQLNNYIAGTDGDNYLDGQGGLDTLVGGRGNDIYVSSSNEVVIIENDAEGIDELWTSVDATLGANIEVLVLLTLSGGSETGDLFYFQPVTGVGNDSDNSIYGNTRDNIIDGGTGADYLSGGAGNDTYYVDNAADQVIEDDAVLATGGVDTVISAIDWTLGNNLENLTLNGDALSGTGNAASNVIYGNARNNTLNGAGGIDTLVGGEGDDTYIIDDAGVTVSENLDGGRDLVISSVDYSLSAEVEDLTLSGSAVTGYGNEGANRITGNAGDNILYGNDGQDVLEGGRGSDTIYGGADADVILYQGNILNPGGGVFGVDRISGFDADNADKIRLVEFFDAAGIYNRTQGHGWEFRGNELWVDTNNDAQTDALLAIFDSYNGTLDRSDITVSDDNVAPGAVSFAVFDDSGVVPSAIADGGTINDTTPLLAGTVPFDAGGVVLIEVSLDNGATWQSANLDGNGGWSLPVAAPLVDGVYQVQVRATDANGNAGAVSTRSFTLDTVLTAPTVNLAPGSDSGASSSDNLTNHVQPVIIISNVDADVPPSGIVVTVDGNVISGTLTDNGDGSWSFTPGVPLSQGVHEIVVTVTDTANNTQSAPPLQVTVDSLAPTALAVIGNGADDVAGGIVGALADGDHTNDPQPTLTGTITGILGAGEVINIYNGSVLLGTATVNGTSWSFTPPVPLADGTHEFSAVVVDQAGNSGTVSGVFELTVDTLAPAFPPSFSGVIDDVGPLQGSFSGDVSTDDVRPGISGTLPAALADGETILIYDGSILLGEATVTGTAWQFTPDTDLAEGIHIFTAYIEDRAGNRGPVSQGFTVTIDRVVPTATFDLSQDTGVDGDFITADSRPTVSGITEPAALIEILDANGSVVASTRADANGDWRIDFDLVLPAGAPLADGTYIVRVADQAGNESRSEFSIDTQITPIAFDLSLDMGAPDLITNWRDQDFRGTAAEPGSIIELIDANGDAVAQVPTVTVSQDGSWTLALRGLLDGLYRLRIRDVAGNSAVTDQAFVISHTVNGSDAVDDSIYGFAQEDEALFGLDGNDTLNGNGGRDSLFGGIGNDTYLIDSYDDWFEDSSTVAGEIDTVISSISISISSTLLSLDPVVGLSNGVTVGGFANQTAMENIERLILSGTAEAAIGNDLSNVIIGNSVNNNIYAGSGNDTVFGGLGLDTLIGELGNDILNGQDDTDLLFGNAGHDTLMGEGGNDSAVGGGGNDWLEGGAGRDDLRGNSNNDTVIGGDDNDLLTGGFANDLLFGDAMADTLSAVGGNDELLAGYGDDTVYGGGGSDSITGGAGNDWLHGGAGNDWFFNTAGGQRLSGVDTLIGGAGDDTLNLQALSWGRQVVSFDDIVTVENGRNIIQGVDRVNNFQGDLIDSSRQIITVGGVSVRGPAQNLADQLDLRGLFTQLGYDPNDGAAAATRQAALDIRPTATTGLFEIWVDADVTATVDFQLIARVQVTSGTIDLTENIILV